MKDRAGLSATAALAPDRRSLLLGALGAVVAPGTLLAGDGIVLIMVDEPGCQYCRKFDAEIGRGYDRTKEGHFAPLLHVRRHAPQLKGLTPVIYTPTFILMRRGEEVGRITGYGGAEYFYSELGDLLSKAGYTGGGIGGPSST